MEYLLQFLQVRSGNKVIIIEKMPFMGKKLLITGKGRCNITSSLNIGDFIENIPGNGKFLYSSFQNFNNKDIINLLKKIRIIIVLIKTVQIKLIIV